MSITSLFAITFILSVALFQLLLFTFSGCGNWRLLPTLRAQAAAEHVVYNASAARALLSAALHVEVLFLAMNLIKSNAAEREAQAAHYYLVAADAACVRIQLLAASNGEETREATDDDRETA